MLETTFGPNQARTVTARGVTDTRGDGFQTRGYSAIRGSSNSKGYRPNTIKPVGHSCGALITTQATTRASKRATARAWPRGTRPQSLDVQYTKQRMTNRWPPAGGRGRVKDTHKCSSKAERARQQGRVVWGEGYPQTQQGGVVWGEGYPQTQQQSSGRAVASGWGNGYVQTEQQGGAGWGEGYPQTQQQSNGGVVASGWGSGQDWCHF
ncbi:hypothetical protein C8F01DRAFT_1079449 [Mycena amicta]|nr:hypothetical protein C8F01DRAFT_1079449 [Mycena amicta]